MRRFGVLSPGSDKKHFTLLPEGNRFPERFIQNTSVVFGHIEKFDEFFTLRYHAQIHLM